jgi:HlyD family secretion protein
VKNNYSVAKCELKIKKVKLCWILIAGLLTVNSEIVVASSEVPLAIEQDSSREKIKVAVIKVQRETISNWALAEGLSQGIRREYLNFEKSGRVTFIAKDNKKIQLREGSFVYGPSKNKKFGELIASIDERADSERLNQIQAGLNASGQQVLQAESSLIRSKNNLALSKSKFMRTQSIWEKKLISKSRFDVARNSLLNAEEAHKAAQAALSAEKSQLNSQQAILNQAKVSLEKTSIYAPFNGILRTVNIRQGDYFSGPGTGLTEREKESSAAVVVVDTSQYEITLNVPIYSGIDIQEDQQVYIGYSSLDISKAIESEFSFGKVAKGRVFSVSPSISLDKRAIEVKVHTSEGAQYLKDGMYVSAWILVSQQLDTLVVPFNAVMMRDNKPYVFVLKGEKAELKQVATGIIGHHKIQVTEGLQPGDLIVATGNHKLVNGSLVQVVEEL